MPSNRGEGYPATFWAKMGKTNTVIGKVAASSDPKIGLEGAYVAIVNASNTDEEYANTTTGANGSYRFEGVSATYFQNLDRFTDIQYKIYVYREPYGEAYSSAFAIDAAALGSPMEVWVIIPVAATPTVRATATPSPTATPMPVHLTITPAPAKANWSLQTIAMIVSVIGLILAVALAYLYFRRR